MGQKIRINESELRRLIREAIEDAIGDNPINPPPTGEAHTAVPKQVGLNATDVAVVERLKKLWFSRLSVIAQDIKSVDSNLQQNLSLAPNVLSEYGIDQNKMNLLKQADAMLINAMNLINNFVSQ
jgi:hypothetical protein